MSAARKAGPTEFRRRSVRRDSIWQSKQDDHEMTDKLNRHGFMAVGSIGLAGSVMTMSTATPALAQTAAQGAIDAAPVVEKAVDRCPVMHRANARKATGGFANMHWWPNQLNLKLLHQHSVQFDPTHVDFKYAK
jgi:hypothetical protein